MDTQQDKPKPKKRGQHDPDFLAQMRAKAQAKKAEQKKIRDAEKLRQQQEHNQKLAEADQLLNPKPKQEITEQPPTPTPSPLKEQKMTKSEKSIDYKQEYYKTKLHLLKQQVAKPSSGQPVDVKPLPHKLLKQEFENDINKVVMQELWKRHFNSDSTPYD